MVEQRGREIYPRNDKRFHRIHFAALNAFKSPGSDKLYLGVLNEPIELLIIQHSYSRMRGNINLQIPCKQYLINIKHESGASWF